MDINNIAMVRATNILPNNGVIKTISETPYLTKNFSGEFENQMQELLIREGRIPPIDFSKFSDEYIKQRNEEINRVMSEYVGYTSDYNSMVLFSLNGLVPDDYESGFGNNVFSNKNYAIIDDLSKHIDDVISLVPTDTAIQGDVKLSQNAILLIKKEIYEQLSDEQKKQIGVDDVRIFDGDLENAIKEALLSTERFIPEKLSLSSKDEGIAESETSDETKETINKIAKEKGIAQVLHMDLLRHQTDEEDKLESVSDEFENAVKVNEYYKLQFYKYIGANIGLENDQLEMLLEFPESSEYVEELISKIKEFGLDNYSELVCDYNKKLETLQKTGELPTPQQIVDSINDDKPIDLVKKVNEMHIDEISMNELVTNALNGKQPATIQSVNNVFDKDTDKSINKSERGNKDD